MPIKIPDSLPARAVLESENIFVMTETRAISWIWPSSKLILTFLVISVVAQAAALNVDFNGKE